MPVAENARAAAGFFLDTNVLVYSFSAQDRMKRDLARDLAGADGATVSTQVLSELAHTLVRRFAVPAAEVRERIASIATGCETILVSPAIVLDALRVVERYGYGFFDSQIVAAALACGAEILYSEDLHDGQVIDGKLRIVSPFARRARQPRGQYRVRRRPARGSSSRRGS